MLLKEWLQLQCLRQPAEGRREEILLSKAMSSPITPPRVSCVPDTLLKPKTQGKESHLITQTAQPHRGKLWRFIKETSHSDDFPGGPALSTPCPACVWLGTLGPVCILSVSTSLLWPHLGHSRSGCQCSVSGCYCLPQSSYTHWAFLP